MAERGVTRLRRTDGSPSAAPSSIVTRSTTDNAARPTSGFKSSPKVVSQSPSTSARPSGGGTSNPRRSSTTAQPLATTRPRVELRQRLSNGTYIAMSQPFVNRSNTDAMAQPQATTQPQAELRQRPSNGTDIEMSSPFVNRSNTDALAQQLREYRATTAQAVKDAELQERTTQAQQISQTPAPELVGRELTAEEYAALTPRQRAAVEYNTEVLAAQNAGGDALNQVLTGFGQDPAVGTRLAISDEMLAKLEDPAVRQNMVASLRYAGQYAAAAAPQSYTMQQLESSIAAGAKKLAEFNLSGGTTADGAQPLGFGTSNADGLVQSILNGLADADDTNTLADAEQFISEVNAQEGLNVSIDDVLNYARLRIDAAEYAGVSNDRELRANYTIAPDTSIRQKPAAQLRQELGLG